MKFEILRARACSVSMLETIKSNLEEQEAMDYFKHYKIDDPQGIYFIIMQGDSKKIEY